MAQSLLDVALLLFLSALSFVAGLVAGVRVGKETEGERPDEATKA